jgi:hypothetical protein
MKDESTAPADTRSNSAPGADVPVPRSRRSKRRAAAGPSSGGTVRFFLSKAEGNGIPALDREFDSEPEAIVESLKTGRSYFVISEWKGLADLSKKVPLIRQEAIGNRRSTSS